MLIAVIAPDGRLLGLFTSQVDAHLACCGGVSRSRGHAGECHGERFNRVSRCTARSAAGWRSSASRSFVARARNGTILTSDSKRQQARIALAVRPDCLLTLDERGAKLNPSLMTAVPSLINARRAFAAHVCCSPSYVPPCNS